MNRRDLLKGFVAAGTAAALHPVCARAAAMDPTDVRANLSAIERKHGGRLGVAMLDTGNGAHFGWRGDERFLMCSTFKFLLVAAVLARVDRGDERLDRRIVFDKNALLEYAPVTKQHVGAPGMSIAQLCEAAITLSDNTAADLLLSTTGGPAGVTHYARGLGDSFTRLDRIEPELNRANGDDDTTTPNAMQADLHMLLLGEVLSQASRAQLTRWLLANQTGADCLHAGLPGDWRIGDKTGSGNTANNDIAIAWPPRRKPLLIAAYYDNAKAEVSARKAVLAEVGRIVAGI